MLPKSIDLVAGSDTGADDTDNITSDRVPSFSGMAPANAEIDVLYNWPGNIHGAQVWGRTSTNAQGEWTFEGTQELEDGAYVFYIEEVKTNLVHPYIDVVIDTAPPSAPSDLSLDAGSETGDATDGITADTTPTITGVAEANTTIEIVSGTSGLSVETEADRNGLWSVTAGALSDGPHSFSARALDVAGNVSDRSASVVIEVDTTPPAFSEDVALMGLGSRTSDRTPTVEFASEAGSRLTIDWGDGRGFVAIGEATGGRQEVTLGVAYGGAGERQVSVRATDEAGNSNSSTVVLDIYDAPPEATVRGFYLSGTDDLQIGTSGNDRVLAYGGNDTVWAGADDAGDDEFYGGDGHDVLGGGAGNDLLDGGGDSDTLWGGSGKDSLLGAEGADLHGGGPGGDEIDAGSGGDTIFGGTGDDLVSGGTGDDLIYNGRGTDIVDGGAGNDLLWGGPGADQMTGGAGADTFGFIAGTGADTVTDFESGTDRLRLRGFDPDLADMSVEQSGFDTLVTLAGETVTLEGVIAGDLDAGDFIFA